MRDAVGAESVVATARIAYGEIKAALARKRRERFLSHEDHEGLCKEFDDDWAHYFVVELSEKIAHLGGRLTEKHDLRAYDAIHLASGVALRGQAGLAISFISFDEKLNRAARKEGLVLALG